MSVAICNNMAMLIHPSTDGRGGTDLSARKFPPSWLTAALQADHQRHRRVEQFARATLPVALGLRLWKDDMQTQV